MNNATERDRLTGNRITELRERNGEGQKEIAALLGVNHHQQISYFENGSRTLPVDKIITLAKHFGVTTDYLLGLTDTKSPDADIQMICNYTGLNEKTVEKLHSDIDRERIKEECGLFIYDSPISIDENGKERIDADKEKEIEDKIAAMADKEIRERRNALNGLLSSAFFDDISIIDCQLSGLSETLALILALIFDDREFLESQSKFDYGEDIKEEIICNVADLLEELNVQSISDEYYLNSYKLNKSLSNYIKEKFSALDLLSEASSRMLKYVFYRVSVNANAAIDADNIYEAFRSGIDKEIEELNFSEGQLKLLNRIYKEVKENG